MHLVHIFKEISLDEQLLRDLIRRLASALCKAHDLCIGIFLACVKGLGSISSLKLSSYYVVCISFLFKAGFLILQTL